MTLKRQNILDLSHEELLSLIGMPVLILIEPHVIEPTVVAETDETVTTEDEEGPKNVTSVGTLIALQYSTAAGNAVATVYSGAEKPDLISWDMDEYSATLVWNQL